jgi:hypothetical protein
MVDLGMSSRDNAKNPGSKVLRYDDKIPRLVAKTPIDGLSIGQMHALDELGMLSRPARSEAPASEELSLIAPDEDVPGSGRAPNSEEVYDESMGAIMPHNPPPPRPKTPGSVKFRQIQKRLDEQAARRPRTEERRIIKCKDLRIRIG